MGSGDNHRPPPVVVGRARSQSMGSPQHGRQGYSKVKEGDNEDGQQESAKLVRAATEQEQMTCGVYLLAGVASVGGFLFGYDTGVVSGAMIEIKLAGSGIDENALGPQQQELIVSCTVASAAVGSWMSGQLQRTRHCGRKSLVILTSIIFIVASVLMALSHSVNALILGRVLVGLSVGAASHTVPIYIAETAPAHMRGMLAGLNNVMVVLGQVVAAMACCYFARRDYEAGVINGWRWMLAWGAAPAIVLLFGVLVLPESPRWLLHVAKAQVKARAALVWLRKDPSVAADELEQIQESIDSEESGPTSKSSSSILRKLCARRTRRALQLGMGLQILQQATGINTIMYYSATILQMVRSAANGAAVSCDGRNLATEGGLTEDDVSDVCWTAPIAMSQLIGTTISMCVVDRLGRRPLALTSLFLSGASLFLLGWAFHGEGNGDLAIVAMCTYLVFFGIGLAPLPWLINAEIYPLETRGTAIGLTTATNWISNFIVSATFLDVTRALSTDRHCPSNHPDGGFWLYAAIAAVGFVWLGMTMPETKGLSLEQIDSLFS
mmetsp:Transcript_67247/g.161173  ORF Transcript_67247/g.161173 Transcript_67247/m.161173 type:complete len:552 (-) Transcript_67247:125-1780(-)